MSTAIERRLERACESQTKIAAIVLDMERQRDEARKCAEEWREHCLKRHVMSQIVSSKLPWEEKE